MLEPKIRTQIDRLAIEHPVVEHCNLRCANCDHGSPERVNRYSDLKKFATDVGNLARVLRLRIFKFSGGEPLLHQGLGEFVQETKASGIAEKIQIWTNGLLLRRVSDSVLSNCDELVVSRYPGVRLSLSSNELKALQDKHGVRILLKETRSFQVTERKTPAKHPEEIQKTFDDCKNAGDWSCHSFIDGYYYKCSRAPFFYPSVSSGLAAQNGIPITADDTFIEELRKYLSNRTPLDACRSCYGTTGPKFPHKQLSRRSKLVG